MHTDQTLDIFDATTIHMGAQFRTFINKTSAFDTHELSRETRARQRRQVKKAATYQGPIKSRPAAVATSSGSEGTVMSQTPLLLSGTGSNNTHCPEWPAVEEIRPPHI